MVSYNPERKALFSSIIFQPGHILNTLYQGNKQIGIKIAVDLLQQGCQSFKPHACINAGTRKRIQLPLFIPIILHEYQIPHFQPTVTIANTQGAFQFLAGITVAPIIMYFTAGTTGSGITHSPEIVLFPHTNNTFGGDSGYLLPELLGLIVIFVDSYPELLLGEAGPFRKEFPGILYCFPLKIVSKGEITEHLEESMVTGGSSHGIQIVVFTSCPNTFLSRGCSAVATFIYS